MGRTTLIAVGIVATLLGVALVLFLAVGEQMSGATAKIVVPDISFSSKRGELLYAENCRLCHGDHGAGSDQGPPLIHKYYESSHHGDASFLSATQNGVPAHHWQFGDMPKQDVTESEARLITTYIREVQRANGIL